MPILFKPIDIGNKQPFIDAGLGCNNPSKLVLKEAQAIFPTHQIGCLVSIGTGQAEVISIGTSGFFQQVAPIDIIDALKAIQLIVRQHIKTYHFFFPISQTSIFE